MLDRQIDLRYNVKMTCLDSLVPAGHLLRKVENVLNFSDIYGMMDYLYCEDNVRPAVEPIVLVKRVLLQHLFGIKSLRQTVREVELNIAYIP